MQDELKACDGQLQAAIQVEIERTIKGLYTMRQAERDMIAMHSARRVMEIVTRADPALAAAQAEVARLTAENERMRDNLQWLADDPDLPRPFRTYCRDTLAVAAQVRP